MDSISYISQVKKLNAFMIRHLRSIMKITWRDMVSNMEVIERAGLPSMEDLLVRKEPAGGQDILRMPSEILTI